MLSKSYFDYFEFKQSCLVRNIIGINNKTLRSQLPITAPVEEIS